MARPQAISFHEFHRELLGYKVLNPYGFEVPKFIPYHLGITPAELFYNKSKYRLIKN